VGEENGGVSAGDGERAGVVAGEVVGEVVGDGEEGDVGAGELGVGVGEGEVGEGEGVGVVSLSEGELVEVGEADGVGDAVGELTEIKPFNAVAGTFFPSLSFSVSISKFNGE